MGVLSISVNGSFISEVTPRIEITERFEAIHHGHADAVARAIEYLSGVVLPRAIAADHRLHEQGTKPAKGFTPERILITTPKEQ